MCGVIIQVDYSELNESMISPKLYLIAVSSSVTVSLIFLADPSIFVHSTVLIFSMFV